MEENISVIHNVIIENRKKLNLSGVRDVLSFDEETIILETSLGKMTIKGEALHIENFNTTTGDMNAIGKVYAVVYTSDAKSSGGFISRLFR